MASRTVTLMTSPMLASRRLEPPNTLMHITSRAPLLSATESLDCICIILLLRLLSPLQHFYNVPGLGFGNGPNMLDAHSVALTAIIFRVMGMNLARATNVLSEIGR